MADTSTLGLRSCGVWTRREAVSVLSRGRVDGLVGSGTRQVPWRGVYCDAGHELDAEQRAWAAVLAAGRAVAAGRTAARVRGLPLVDDLDPATGHDEHLLDEVAVGRRLPVQRWAGRVLRPVRTALSSTDLVRLPSGLWVTSPARTLVDCAGLLAPDALVCAMDAGLHRRLVTLPDLQAALRTRTGRAHSLALGRAVALSDGRAESPPETLARLLLLPALPGLEPQVERFDEVGQVLARFDLADETVRLAVECDGTAGHAGAQMVAKDRPARPPHRGVRLVDRAGHVVRAAPGAGRRLRRIADVHAARAAHLPRSA